MPLRRELEILEKPRVLNRSRDRTDKWAARRELGRGRVLLRASASEAVAQGFEFSYAFLFRPTPKTRRLIEGAGGRVFWFFEIPGTR